MSDAAELATLGSLRAEPVAQESVVAAESDQVTAPQLPKLHLACQKGDTEAAIKLVEAGADVKEVAFDGSTPLHWAASANRYKLTEYLLDRGADPGFASGFANASALHWACRNGFVYISNLLIQRGADPNVADDQGYTCLHLAVHSSNVLLVVYLVHLEVDVDRMDKSGRTPLHWAAYQGDHMSVECLLKAGASPHVKDSEEFTPLHWGLVSRSDDLVIALLNHGADIYAKNKDGKNAFDVAADMDTKKQLDNAFLATGRDTKGAVIHTYFSVYTTKVLTFLWPTFALGASLYMFSTLPVLGAILGSLATVFIIHKIYGKFIYYNAWPTSKVFTHSPLLAGIYCGFYFWIVFYYVQFWLPATADLSPIVNGIFSLLAIAVTAFYVAAARMDPGIVRPGNVKSKLSAIKDLLAEGKYSTKYFDLSKSIRKPVRSQYNKISGNVIARFDHYCPWAANAIGVRNHRAFVAYLTSLAVALVFAGIIFYEFLGTVSSNYFEAMSVASGSTSLVILSTFQFSWILLLTFVQNLQVFRAVTTQEVIQAANNEVEDDRLMFGSLPADHPKAVKFPAGTGEGAPSNNTNTARHSHGQSRGFRMCLNLLGVRQFSLTAKAMFRKKARNLADHGFQRNFLDFWSGSGFILNPKAGYGILNGQEVDYYTLWDMPGVSDPISYDYSDAERALRRLA